MKIKEEYKKSWNYIKESKKFIWFAVILFFVFALVGFLFPVPPEIADEILKFIQKILEQTEGMSQGELIRFLFLNNLFSSFIGIVSGVLFGIFPTLFAIANGYLLGFVAKLSVGEVGILSLWRLFPHGIFELPAVFISFGLGIKLGTFLLADKKWKTLKNYFWNSVHVFILIIVPLLIIAAIIEGSLIVLFS